MNIIATPLLYNSGYKYRLSEKFVVHTPLTGRAAMIEAKDGGRPWVELRQDGVMILREGYAYDGPSGPTRDTPNSMRPAGFHDGAYQLGRASKLHEDDRQLVDDFFYEFLLFEGMLRARALMWYEAVRLCAGYAYRAQEIPPISIPEPGTKAWIHATKTPILVG